MEGSEPVQPPTSSVSWYSWPRRGGKATMQRMLVLEQEGMPVDEIAETLGLPLERVMETLQYVHGE